MGMWAFNPWDNDRAADWYGDLMDSTKLREAWLSGINESPLEAPEVVRAAAALFVMLGRVYIWPIATYDQDLENSIAALERVAKSDEYQEVPELIGAITAEITELKTRRKKGPEVAVGSATEPPKPWWKVW